MHTPMFREGDAFAAKLQAPLDASLDYGFLITDKRSIFDIVMPVWDGDPSYQMIVSNDSVVEIEAEATLANELSDILDNGFYFLVGLGLLLGTWFLIYFFLGF
jgi:hypothetical protein